MSKIFSMPSRRSPRAVSRWLLAGDALGLSLGAVRVGGKGEELADHSHHALPHRRLRHLSQSDLYRCLKRQALRAYLTPSLIFQNYFIRNYLWSFLGGQIINLAATIGYILRGNQGRASLDL